MQKRLYWKGFGKDIGKRFTGASSTKYLVVGGGIAGLSLAYFLIQKKVRPEDITIIEADRIGMGSTGHSAGMLVPESETEHDISWGGFIKRFGKALTKKYRAAHFDATATIREIIRDGHIHCEARMLDFLILAGKDSEHLVKESLKARRKLGERPGELRDTCLDRELLSPRFTIGGKIEQGLSVNPRKLAEGFALYLKRKGVHIYEHSTLHSTDRNTAVVNSGNITFGTIVYARGMGETSEKLHRYVTTIALTNRISKRDLKKMRLDDRDMFVDEHEVGSYHYGKITDDNRLLIGYGDTTTTQTVSAGPVHQPHTNNIRKFLKRAFPQTPLRIEYVWSAGYALTKNDVPLAKLRGKTAYLNGAGIQLGSMVAAEYLAAKLMGKKHPLEKLFT